MKERLLESFAILLAGLFSADRRRSEALAQAPRSLDAGQPSDEDPRAPQRDKN